MEKRLVRNSQDRILGGVCSGLANYLDIDTSVVRILFVIGMILPGPFALIYLILWILMPLDTKLVTTPPPSLPRPQDPTGEWRYDPYTGQAIERQDHQ